METGTWHYGLIARWWAEFNVAEPEEVAFLRAAVAKYGEPVLDLGCGTGRLMLPLLEDGVDVDGSDISADMIAEATRLTSAAGFSPQLTVQPLQELELQRTYRTIYLCGVFGIGGSRDNDREGLRRAFRHLEPGGAILITGHELPYAGADVDKWARWLPGHRAGIPREWPAQGQRKKTSDGDEIELFSRLAELDPLKQVQTLEIRARLWHGGEVVREESGSLKENLYFAQEILSLLGEAGFRNLAVEAGYSGRPATADDATVAFLGTK